MGFRETTVTKERITAEKHTETDRPKVSETDAPNLSHNTDFKAISSSEVIDSLVNIFKKHGLMDASEAEKSESKQTDLSNKNDYSQSLEKREDGKYYDKETGKVYDPIDAWKKYQTTLVKHHKMAANYSIEKAKKVESITDAKETKERALTDEEKQCLNDVLGLTDKQIEKCTIYGNGIIRYRTDREDLEGKTSENSVPYERNIVAICGFLIEGVFPVFDSAFDAKLPENLEKASNAKQFKECNSQLKKAVQDNPDIRNRFSPEQLKDIEDGKTPEGYVWHHHEKPGKMQLVKIEDHDRTQGGAAHTGGKTLWGGGYGHDASSENTNSQELLQQSNEQEV